MGKAYDRYVRQTRKRLSYQTWLNLFESMRKGQYMNVMAQIYSGRCNGTMGSFKYRSHMSGCLDSIVQIQEDYEQYGDKMFELFRISKEPIYAKYDGSENHTRFRRGINSKDDEEYATHVHRELARCIKWRNDLKSGRRFDSWEWMNNGTKDKPAWLERNLAQKPKDSGHRGRIRGDKGGLQAGSIPKGDGNNAKKAPHAKGTH